MKYFKDFDGYIYAYEEDGSQDDIIPPDYVALTAQEEADHLAVNGPDLVPDQLLFRETQWRTAELEFVNEQILRKQDNDPQALPGGVPVWRIYRVAVRAWEPGAVGFPDVVSRPHRP